MKWEKISNLIGLTLVVVCFVFALGRIISLRMRESTTNPERQTTLRIAHGQLESGVREAIDAIAKRYMEQNPNVRVVQIAIPTRVYKNWRITQLVGGTPPDLVGPAGLLDEQVARYFTSMSDLANRPNPYNKGTELENLPLRETFFDGMESGLNPGLMDYYSIPSTVSTFRMFYNLDLLEEVTGSRRVPSSFEEFNAMCEKTREFAKRTGRHVTGVGGAANNANLLMDFFFTSQTQRLLQESLNPTGMLSSVAPVFRVARSYWQGKWNMNSPEVESGLTLVRDLVRDLPPGFDQIGPDDATFYFAQGGSVSIPSGTWDAGSYRLLCPFPIEVGKLPLPDKNHPFYSRFSYGVVSEASNNAGFVLAVPKGDKEDLARDFLLFMTSQEMNKLWTEVSGWPPAVIGITPPPDVRALMPSPGGYPSGFSLNAMGADCRALYGRNLFRLIGPQGSVSRFLDGIRSDYGAALASDLQRSLDGHKDNVRRSDSVIAATALTAGDDPEKLQRLDLLIQARVANERNLYDTSQALLFQP